MNECNIIIPTYWCSAYRGKDGDNATEQVIRDNVKTAIGLGLKIGKDFPQFQLTVPHKELICNQLWKDNKVTSEDIVRSCCKIVLLHKLLIAYGAVYGGMIQEILTAEANGITVYYMDEYNEQAKYELSQIAYNLLEMSEPSEDRDS